ncbi:efflux RND transporter periplasmic adaptor subunit [Holdemanella sp. MSK.7.32]|jgi:HlyD family secretion protein|uniref:efflux RND transporter periplasmic adaptor subunit n=1 Tax=Holdemanella TaxID=1573535 RepID=UPI00210A4C38|nr:efflux RND transporter periplasmic adaptor subunit [Holdemanella sp. MSK.7.32]MBD9216532.1 efflux RND transporter periplasmic adaptor subunit [Solobacterium sp.]MBN2949217.1 efflux RND transporter periplasmic adaptor subunit [Holdemanella sp.]MCQ4804953.1 efflux RND transporter periplasmic adaptor subunit [Holdemanella sp. MSK.7.32]
MKKKTKIIILISACILIAVIGIYFLFPKESNNQNIYVQKVSTIIGSSYTENRYSGVVESSETVDINQDGNKSITDMYVEAGQKVSKGDKLFSYDTTEASNSIAQKKLDIEAQNNEIQAQNNTIADYKAELNKGGDKVEIQARINDASFAIRQAQNTIKATQTEIDQLNKQIENSTVLSTIDGIIKEVNKDGGTDESGNQKPLVSITQTTDFRVKGSISEMGTISEGTSVIVRSRVNEDQIYKGTVTKVETDPQSNSNNNFYGADSSESASKYPFYVSLDNNKGLMLGQHVYIEADNGQSTKKKGIWLDASFIVSDDNGNSYVWVSEKGKLKKRKVELGKTDEETYTTKIKSGLSVDDYIAWADDSYSEGMKTTTEYQTETDGDANAS